MRCKITMHRALQPSSPLQILKKLDAERREEVEEMIRDLENENKSVCDGDDDDDDDDVEDVDDNAEKEVMMMTMMLTSGSGSGGGGKHDAANLRR